MKINSFNNFIIRLNPVVFVLVFLLLSIIITLPLFLGFDTKGKDYNDAAEMFRKCGIVFFFFVTVIFMPLFETLVFQGAIIEIIRANTKTPYLKFYSSIFFSSLIFSLFHCYNLIYFIEAFLGGLVLATAYYYSIYRKESAVLLITIIHGTRNLIPFIIELIEKHSVSG